MAPPRECQGVADEHEPIPAERPRQLDDEVRVVGDAAKAWAGRPAMTGEIDGDGRVRVGDGRHVGPPHRAVASSAVDVEHPMSRAWLRPAGRMIVNRSPADDDRSHGSSLETRVTAALPGPRRPRAYRATAGGDTERRPET